MAFFILLIFVLPWVPLWSAVSPYAPAHIGTNPSDNDVADYTLDSVGNRLTDAHGQTLQMGLVSKPVVVRQDNDWVRFAYGMRGRRYLRLDNDQNKTFYLNGGDVEYKVDDEDSAQSVVNIKHGQYSSVVQVMLAASGMLQYRYYVRDHLGSPLRVVDNGGVAEASVRYDAWGQSTAASGIHRPQDDGYRGFTGHESIASVGLTHMNGRVQDPEIGQFLGPDPVAGAGLPALNRYSYVHNSPLGATDPSGYMADNYKHIRMFRGQEGEYEALIARRAQEAQQRRAAREQQRRAQRDEHIWQPIVVRERRQGRYRQVANQAAELASARLAVITASEHVEIPREQFDLTHVFSEVRRHSSNLHELVAHRHFSESIRMGVATRNARLVEATVRRSLVAPAVDSNVANIERIQEAVKNANQRERIRSRFASELRDNP